jgi:predicted kinase
MKQLIIMVGNIGTGKSTYAKKYQKQDYIIISRDQLRYAIGNGQYVYNKTYEPIIWKSELYFFKRFVDAGANIVIDGANITKLIRRRYISYAKKEDYNITIIEMPRLIIDEAVKNRMKDPHGQPDERLWSKIWNKFESLYETPTIGEGVNKVIQLEKKDVVI